MTTHWLLAGCVGAGGLVAGWVLRGLIVRCAVPAGEPVRRCCPSGQHPLPLLIITPAGRCRICGQRVGPPALAVEAVTAVLTGALAARLHPGLVLVAGCVLALCAVPLAFIDGAVRRLPDVLTVPAYLGTLVVLLAAAAAGGQWAALARAGLGGLALAGFYLLLAVISPAGMGMGDVKAAASLGAMLGWLSWTALVAGTIAGFLLAALCSLLLLLAGRVTRKQHIPFGPFMIAGAFLVILAGPAALQSL